MDTLSSSDTFLHCLPKCSCVYEKQSRVKILHFDSDNSDSDKYDADKSDSVKSDSVKIDFDNSDSDQSDYDKLILTNLILSLTNLILTILIMKILILTNLTVLKSALVLLFTFEYFRIRFVPTLLFIYTAPPVDTLLALIPFCTQKSTL